MQNKYKFSQDFSYINKIYKVQNPTVDSYGLLYIYILYMSVWKKKSR